MKVYLGVLVLIQGVMLWQVNILERAKEKDAFCNDGSSPIYMTDYFEKSTSWLYYLPGGGMCPTPYLCQKRQEDYKYWTSTKGEQNADFQHASGIFSRDCKLNPQFCKSNLVYVFYCSSDLWSGQNSIKLPNGDDFHFRGKNIVLEVVKELLQKSNLKQAKSFFIAGNSAGGFGAQHMADPVHQLLQKELKREIPQFLAILDSSILLGNPVYKPYDCEATGGLCGLEKLITLSFKNQNNLINEECRQDHPKEPEICLANEGLNYMKTKAIAMVYQFDMVILSMNGVNLAAPTDAENTYIYKSGLDIKRTLKELYESGSIDYVYMNSCLFHTITLFKNEFLINEVGGKTAARAVYEWATLKKRAFIEDKCDMPMCSQNCSAPQHMDPIHTASKPLRKEII